MNSEDEIKRARDLHGRRLDPEGVAPILEPETPETPEAPPETPEALRARMQEWFQDAYRTTYLCDVRTPEEFSAGHIPGAYNLPISFGSLSGLYPNPDFAAVARAYGGWAETVETTGQFAPALDRALAQNGIRLLHCKTDIEQITNAKTLSELWKQP